MTAQREIDLKLNAPQLKAHHLLFDPAGQPFRRRTVFMGWGRGVGKSWYRRQVWWLLIALLDYKYRDAALDPFRGVRITSLAPTLKQWKDIHWGGITHELVGRNAKWGWLGAKLDAQSGQIRFPGGSVINPFPATAHNARTARGVRTDILDADEVDDIDAEVYDSVAVPWLSEPWSLGIELLGGTPTRGRHGLFWRSLQAGKLGQRLRDSPLSDDEILKLPEVELVVNRFAGEIEPSEVLEALRSTYQIHATYKDVPETVGRRAVVKARIDCGSEAKFKREWEADPDSGEGLVYPFEDAFHVRSPPKNVVWSEILIAADHGWQDPGCLLLIGIIGHGRDAVAWVIDEIYEQHREDSWWVNALKVWTGWYPNHKFYADPSRPGLIEDFRKQAQAKVQHVDNAIEDGVGAVINRLAKIKPEEGPEYARLYVAPNCVNTINEFGKYRRKPDPRYPGLFLETIEDRWNHAMDCVRYAILNRFGKVSSGRNNASLDQRSS